MAASRGKSMEELGTAVVSRPKVLSKSFDQLNEIEMSDREKGNSIKQHYATRFGSDDVQVGPGPWTFKEPGLLEHTATSTASSWVRTSPLSGKEGKVTATSSSPRGTSENSLIVRYHSLQFILFLKH